MMLSTESMKLVLMCVVLKSVYGIPIDNDDAIDLSSYRSQLHGQPDNKFGEMLRNWNATNTGNPEELGPYMEGDILVPINQSPTPRNGMVSQSYRWPNAVIPYEIVGPYDSRSVSMIQNAMNVYQQKTCIKFRRRTSNDRDYISIQNGQSGCWSSIGRIGGAQTVNLQAPACTTVVGTVLHEFMHSAGFMHEQNREERDQYITIQYPNIQRGYESNFMKAQKGQTSGFGVGYDYGSVMHYSATAFSTNGKPTIVTKVSLMLRTSCLFKIVGDDGYFHWIFVILLN